MKIKRNFLSETIIVALFPIVAYGMAYFFEAGYLSFFGIPAFIIKVSLENFFVSLSYMAFFMTVFFIPVGNLLIHVVMNEINEKYDHYIIAVFLIFIGLIIFYLMPIKLAFLLNGGILVAGAFYYLLPLFAKGENYKDKFEKTMEANLSSSERNIGRSISKIIGRPAFVTLVACVLIMPGFSQMLGLNKAKNTNSFLVSNISGNDFALIRTYEGVSVLVLLEKKWKDLYHFDFVLTKKFKIEYENRNFIGYQARNIDFSMEDL